MRSATTEIGSSELRETLRFRERAAGVAGLRERQAAEKQVVECHCGHEGALEDVQWWGAAQRFLGNCPSCHTTLSFTVPESAR